MMFCIYVGFSCVIYSVFTIEHPRGEQYTPPISVTMQCVINLTFQFFFIYLWIWVAITLKEFTGFEWALMMQTMENAKATVMYCPMLAILFVGTRMRALMITDNKGAPQGYAQTDEKIAAKEAGLDLRPCTTTEIQKHLDDFGLEQEFGTYGKIRGLSGGQKVKLVLAAAMWNCPHLLVLDEPTNYLDREALGALSSALNEWGGSVLMISHNKEFYSSVCKEEWNVGGGKVTVEGISMERAMKAVARKKKFDKEETGDEKVEKAGGNTNADGDKYKDAAQNFWGQSLAKKEARNFSKAQKKGDVAAMRKILQVPDGKIMPGYENLGDGKTIP